VNRNNDDTEDPAAAKWARLRFAVVGPLLASPRSRGELRAALEKQAAQTWRHPTREGSVQFSVRTLERWYYAAKNAPVDPVGALRRKVRTDAGSQRSMSVPVCQRVADSHRAHSGWSGRLHYDNVVELTRKRGRRCLLTQRCDDTCGRT